MGLADTSEPPIDDQLLLELMVLVEAQAYDRDGTGSVERAYLRRRTDAKINRHLDHLAALGLLTARHEPGHRRRVCTLTDEGRAWCREHFPALARGDY